MLHLVEDVAEEECSHVVETLEVKEVRTTITETNQVGSMTKGKMEGTRPIHRLFTKKIIDQHSTIKRVKQVKEMSMEKEDFNKEARVMKTLKKNTKTNRII